MKCTLIILMAVFIVSGCIRTEKKSESVMTPELPTNSDYNLSKKECEAKGGQFIGCETITGYACSLPTKDGGKPCSDSDECEQECVAPPNCKIGTTNVKGTCAEKTHLVCNGVQSVENGRCDSIIIA